ncbi:MAG: cytochrome b/b6 domain-containing protein [Acidobacteriaceae bacterium]|nr:cytochrome b/b6 domain-containing protein [Acidobacteriaceae bacterium]
MPKLKLKHLVAMRWFHWINFPLLALMIWSGFLIYWAYPIYGIGPIRFPQWLFHALHMNHRLADGMAMHFFFMWLFVVNGVLYVAYTILSGEWRLLVPTSASAFRDAWHVALCDLHLRDERPHQEKYNAAQQISYTGIIVMGIGSVLTGLAIYKPAQLSWLAALFGGYPGARLVHFLLTIGYCLFFLVHVIQVVIAGWNNFRSMIIGYELVEEHE